MNPPCLFTLPCLVCSLTGALAPAEELSVSFDQITAIPDNGSPMIVELELPSSKFVRTVTEVRLSLELEHPWVGDLSLEIESPSGDSALLLDRTGLVPAGFPGPFGCGGDDVNATLRDDASLSVDEVCSIEAVPVLTGPLRPAQPLARLIGSEPSGVWRVRLSDQQSGDAGILRSVTLVVVVEPDCDGDGVPAACDCPADLDTDGHVGGSDLSFMLSSWGSGGSADLDGDGVVTGTDLAQLLSSWGLCN